MASATITVRYEILWVPRLWLPISIIALDLPVPHVVTYALVPLALELRDGRPHLTYDVREVGSVDLPAWPARWIFR